MNFQIEPTVDYGDGEVHDNIIKDAITQARWELKTYGANTAMRNQAALQEMIDAKTWRSVEAADLLARIRRLSLSDPAIREAVSDEEVQEVKYN
jgi:hypothetical protein